LYALFLLVLRAGVKRALRQPKPPPSGQIPFLSVLVPFRNEQAHLGALIQDLKSQHYPAFSYEVILIDDHSTDGSAALAPRLIRDDPRFRLAQVSKNEQGKKQALREGIRLSKGHLILTTDADCRLPEDWCRTMGAAFENPDIKMGLGPVRLIEDNTFFGRLVAMEYASVVAVTAATAGVHRPVMASGANLAFRKDAFYEVGGYFDEQTLASGDDQFLMEKMVSRFHRPVVFVPHAQALVSTLPPRTVRQFLAQRFRWAGKWSRLAWPARLFAVGVFVFHAVALLSGVLVVVAPQTAGSVLAAWLVKAIAEFLLLRPVVKFMQNRWSFPAFIFWQAAYPVYALTVAVGSARGAYRWKERTWKQQR